MQFDFRFKIIRYNVFVFPFMKEQFQSICEELLDTWQSQLEQHKKIDR